MTPKEQVTAEAERPRGGDLMIAQTCKHCDTALPALPWVDRWGHSHCSAHCRSRYEIDMLDLESDNQEPDAEDEEPDE